ncbi:MAG TPA: GNAT family N-acetyltransferase [Candidatus Obscuribacterales bacterium]
MSLSVDVDFESIACHVRPAGMTDLEQVADVLASSFYPPLGWQRWFHPLLRFSIYEDLKQRLHAEHKHYRCLTAIAPVTQNQQNFVVGTVEIAHRQPSLFALHRPHQVYLSNLAVREGCRRQGVARRLLQSAEQLSLEWGFRELYLHVMADNTQARRLYQTMGYQLHQVEPTLFSLVNLQPARLLLKKVLPPRSL